MSSHEDMGQRGVPRKVKDAELIELVRDADDPFVTAPELSEQLPLTRQRILQQLTELEEQGLVARKECGSGVAWWVPV